MSAFFQNVADDLESVGFNVVQKDFARPWGGFLVIDDSQFTAFNNKYFNGMRVLDGQKRTPKILMILPRQKLSWQYHNRRSEIWTVVKGSVGAILSTTDDETETYVYNEGDIIYVNPQVRHRLVGLDKETVVAEIWEHTDPNHPSDENDIVRLSDDYGRNENLLSHIGVVS